MNKKNKLLPNTIEALGVDLERTERHQQRLDAFRWDGDVLNQIGQRLFRMDKALSKMDPSLKASFKKHLISFTKDGNYATNSYKAFIESLLCALNLDPPINFDTTWISRALEKPSFKHNKRGLFSFFLHWQERDSTAITLDALRLLKLATPNHTDHHNVLSDDPEKSWLTDDEYEALLKLVWNNYDEGISCTQITFIKLLSMQYGRRPLQLAYLKVGDIHKGILGNQDFKEHIIKFPSVKDRIAEASFRGGSFESHPLADHLWDLYCIHRKEVRALYEHTLGITLTNNQLNQLPLFCSEARIEEARKLIISHDLSLNENFDSEFFHLPKFWMSDILCWKVNTPSCNYDKDNSSRISRPNPPISSRTGQIMAVTATRMRHTRVRQLARKGVPKHMLSQWLGHTSAHAVDAYYNDPAEQARKIDEAMAPMLIPLAMAFTGKLIDSEDQATRASDPTSKLELASEGELKSVGRCGKHSFCATTSVPIPCYRCKYFEPLVDAPHHEVLKALMQRQAAENEILKLGGTRNLLIPIDLSTDIQAVINCITHCNARRAERESTS